LVCPSQQRIQWQPLLCLVFRSLFYPLLAP
jgi:hypothetical protein